MMISATAPPTIHATSSLLYVPVTGSMVVDVDGVTDGDALGVGAPGDGVGGAIWVMRKPLRVVCPTWTLFHLSIGWPA